MRYLSVLLFAAPVFAVGPEPGVITGRVFDVYHRPVRSARVATMEPWFLDGRRRSSNEIVAQNEVTVDDAGMYRLTLPPGRYVLGVLPPARALDFATVFPAYFQDTVEFDQAQPIDLRTGEVRPFVDFLLLEVESHRLEGGITGLTKGAGPVSLTLSVRKHGYAADVQTVPINPPGHFRLEHIPAGSYELRAYDPVSHKSGSAQLQITKPETAGIQIHLRSAAR